MSEDGGTVAVSREQLEAVAALAAQPTAAPAAKPAKVAKAEQHDEEARVRQTAEARKWTAKQPAAVQGENGSGQTFAVACGLVRDWGLSVEEARPILEEYSERCDPPWSAKELDHKLADAEKAAAKEPERVGRFADPDDDDEGERRRSRSQYERLVALVCGADAPCELWATPGGEAFASVERDGHAEHYALSSQEFADWLHLEYADKNDEYPKPCAVEEATKGCGPTARSRERYESHLRVGFEPGVVWHDLADAKWQAVRITAEGWTIEVRPTVRFRRSKLLRPLPAPETGGTWGQLRPLVNVDDEHWPIVLAFLVGCFLPTGAFPILCPHGSRGSGKSVLTKQLQKLVDPRVDEATTGVPAASHDQLLVAENSWLQVYNNTSKISDAASDQLCTLVEGASLARRGLYTDKSLAITEARRPVVVNGIAIPATRGDLLSRLLHLPLEKPPHSSDESGLWRTYDALVPKLLGCLYDAIASALRNWPTVVIPNPPRLHDLARWAVAAEPALGLQSGDILAALQENAEVSSEQAVESSALPHVLRRIVGQRGGRWRASASEWLDAIQHEIPPAEQKALGIKIASSLSGELQRLRPDLFAAGLVAEKGRTSGVRWWEISLAPRDEKEVAP
jgi:hypothetical protein